jgi:hypothetical protein
MARLLKKISPATVCQDLLQRLDIPNAPAQVDLFDIWGFASGIKASKPDAETPVVRVYRRVRSGARR